MLLPTTIAVNFLIRITISGEELVLKAICVLFATLITALEVIELWIGDYRPDFRYRALSGQYWYHLKRARENMYSAEEVRKELDTLRHLVNLRKAAGKSVIPLRDHRSVMSTIGQGKGKDESRGRDEPQRNGSASGPGRGGQGDGSGGHGSISGPGKALGTCTFHPYYRGPLMPYSEAYEKWGTFCTCGSAKGR